MAITIGNKTASNANPSGSTQTLSHNMNVGADGTLLVVITMPSTVSFNSVTYDGVAMTLVRNQLFSGLSQRQGTYILQAPSTGSNNIVVSFTGSQFNGTSIFAQSFTGAGGLDVEANNGASTSPNSQSLTIQANSIIYTTGISDNAQSFGYDIGGSTRTNEFAHNTNKQVEGALSATGLLAGSQNVTTKADAGTVTNYRIAILEAGTIITRRRIIIC
tara:strand:+ start:400 stop:1050 length:651 start_codon:yes stop_codon:yes gene_type:complete